MIEVSVYYHACFQDNTFLFFSDVLEQHLFLLIYKVYLSLLTCFAWNFEFLEIKVNL